MDSSDVRISNWTLATGTAPGRRLRPDRVKADELDARRQPAA
jgi:hypothetical protein